jgi:hypothetical protein
MLPLNKMKHWFDEIIESFEIREDLESEEEVISTGPTRRALEFNMLFCGD